MTHSMPSVPIAAETVKRGSHRSNTPRFLTTTNETTCILLGSNRPLTDFVKHSPRRFGSVPEVHPVSSASLPRLSRCHSPSDADSRIAVVLGVTASRSVLSSEINSNPDNVSVFDGNHGAVRERMAAVSNWAGHRPRHSPVRTCPSTLPKRWPPDPHVDG